MLQPLQKKTDYIMFGEQRAVQQATDRLEVETCSFFIVRPTLAKADQASAG
jgi:hypothetical protein